MKLTKYINYFSLICILPMFLSFANSLYARPVGGGGGGIGGGGYHGGSGGGNYENRGDYQNQFDRNQLEYDRNQNQYDHNENQYGGYGGGGGVDVYYEGAPYSSYGQNPNEESTIEDDATFNQLQRMGPGY